LGVHHVLPGIYSPGTLPLYLLDLMYNLEAVLLELAMLLMFHLKTILLVLYLSFS